MGDLLATFKGFLLDFSNSSQIVIDLIDSDLVLDLFYIDLQIYVYRYILFKVNVLCDTLFYYLDD